MRSLFLSLSIWLAVQSTGLAYAETQPSCADFLRDGLAPLVHSGSKIFFPIGQGASNEAFAALIELAREGRQFTVYTLTNRLSSELLRQAAKTQRISLKSFFIGPGQRELCAEGLIEYLPCYLSDPVRWVSEGLLHFDLIFLRARVAGGFLHLGPNQDHLGSLIEMLPDAKIVVERHDEYAKLPTATISQDRASLIFYPERTRNKSFDVPQRRSSAQTVINKTVADLIPPGATLQVGIGKIFSGLGEALVERGINNLRIRTEMFGEALAPLLGHSGVVEILAGFVLGENIPLDRIQLLPTVTLHDLGAIIETPLFHAVNTGLQVNLYGEVNATMGYDGRVSSPGGQVEFMMAASRSLHGKAIIALNAIDDKTGRSNIVLTGMNAGPITTPGEMVTHVVTQFGVAVLRGRSETARARALISIAAPQFREGLLAEAYSRGLIRP